MKQLSNEKKVDSKKTYWKNDNDIDQDVIDYISKRCDTFFIYLLEINKKYCQKCFKELDSNHYCSNCSIRYEENNCLYVLDFDELKYNKQTYYDFCFDVKDNEVYLYYLEEQISFKFINEKPKRNIEVKIINTFKVLKDGIYSIKDRKFYKYGSNDIENLDNRLNPGYVYPYNLDKLKKTIYKYSYIWKGKEQLKPMWMNIVDITDIPLNNKRFEYCMKNEMYKLGFTLEDKPLNIPLYKKYIPFIQQNDLYYNQYVVLSIFNELDIDFISSLLHTSYVTLCLNEKKEYKKIKEELTKNIKINKLKDYFNNTNINITYENLDEYFDYIDMAKKLGYNMKNKKILYPEDLIKEHNKLVKQYTLVNNKEQDEKIKKLSKLLEVNNYEDNNYIIYPAHSVEELVDESRMQNNCVKTYIEKYSENKCQIYFMRKKENKDKSFVTIEVCNGKVVQAKLKNNECINTNVANILNKWERDLVEVY